MKCNNVILEYKPKNIGLFGIMLYNMYLFIQFSKSQHIQLGRGAVYTYDFKKINNVKNMAWQYILYFDCI